MLATRGRARKVILTHIVWGNQEREPDIAAIVEGVRRTYAGEIVPGNDLQVFAFD